ncbi:hypothetical protein KGO95_02890 [Patescibacteria group bacterium]|nr:hypothetical protein [Patescibacteria group bacterium]
MKRWASILIALCLFSQEAFATDAWEADLGTSQYGSYTYDKDQFHFTADVSDLVKAVNVSLQIGERKKILFTFLSKRIAPHGATAVRATYVDEIPLVRWHDWRLEDESRLGTGIVSSHYFFPDGNSVPSTDFTHYALGAGNYLVNTFHLGSRGRMSMRVGGDETGSEINDTAGAMPAQWDSYRMLMDGKASWRFSRLATINATASLSRTRYNPDRYFFVQNWAKEYHGNMSVTWAPVSQWEIIPSLGYDYVDIERDARIDLERPSVGMMVVRKNIVSAHDRMYVRGIYAPWRQMRGQDTLLAAGFSYKNVGGEVYRRETNAVYSTFVEKSALTGLRFSWRFGEAAFHAREGLKRYRSPERKYAFYYPGDQVTDDTSLSRTQQAERLGNLRRRIAWSGQYLTWKEAPNGGLGFRYQDTTYAGRAGDCDEQSCMNNSMDRLNGYRAYSLAWWDYSKAYEGHAVELVQDLTNKEWFWVEYGMVYKLRVNPNMTMEQIMREALAQNNQFSALPIKDPSQTHFELIQCDTQGTYTTVSPYYTLRTMMRSSDRPAIERGIDLFTKRDFVLGD